ncbi:MAG: TetR/AcrR family transcriptional regulator [Aureispira sp.]|nr:TetR/AcrR family transcriptional regulator [Aureispira sp.]
MLTEVMGREDQILEDALGLFNTHGAMSTSLRQIASQMEISDGNLRYYYKTKEVLVLRLFEQMLAEMNVVIVAQMPLLEGDYNHKRAIEGISALFRIMYKYKFFYIEAALYRHYPQVGSAFKGIYEARKMLFEQMIIVYKHQGILSTEVSDRQYDMAFEQFFIISDNWVKYVEIGLSDNDLEDIIAHYAELCIAIFYPFWVENVVK